MSGVSDPCKLILDATSDYLKIDKAELEDFIDYVQWILETDEYDWEREHEHGIGIYVNCFDPTDFWPLFADSLSWVLQQQADSPSKLHTLNFGLQALEKRQIRFLYLQLLRFLSEFKHDPELEWWYKRGKEFPRTLEMLIDPYWMPYTQFSEIKDKLELLSDNTDRLKLALAEKSSVEQDLAEVRQSEDQDSIDYLYLSTVLQQCRIEVDCLREIIELDTQTNQKEATSEYEPSKRGLTQSLAMLLLDELFPKLKTASNTAKAEFLSLLTGWSSESLRQKWSDYERGNPSTMTENLEQVALWKKRLKLANKS